MFSLLLLNEWSICMIIHCRLLLSCQLQEKADAILEEAGQQCKQVLKAVSQRREKLDPSQKEAPS